MGLIPSTPRESPTAEPAPAIESRAFPIARPLQLVSQKPRWRPRFSLLNLLLFTALIAVGVAYVTMKSSLEKQLRDERIDAEAKQRKAFLEAWTNQSFAHGEEQIQHFISGFPSLDSFGAIYVLTKRDQTILPSLVLILDPQKTYALHTRLQNSDAIQKQTVVIERIDSTEHARMVLELKFAYGKLIEPLDILAEEGEELRCDPRLTSLTSDLGSIKSYTREVLYDLPRLMLPLEKRPQLPDFYECFTAEWKLHASGETLLFKIDGQSANNAERPSLQISLEEISEAEIKQIDQPLYFKE